MVPLCEHPAFGAAILAAFGAAALSVAAGGSGSTRVEAHPAAPSYARDVRPILSDRCFACHGPDEGEREARLRLDTFEGATAARRGGAAVVPGDPESSTLLERVHAADEDERMPPVSSGKRALSDAERDVLRRWIAAGAPYEPHWAFVAPSRPPLPAVRDAAWCRNEFDRYVLAEMESRGVAPSPEADRATLARRVFLDLTGLPPTPEEIDAFERDRAPDALERLVDRLMNQEPYRSRHAERVAQPWLDAARYADTSGIHTDAGRQTWAWRDWVLAAFRDNLPFDRFLTEQIAGDLVPNADDATRTATGFLRNHVTTDEGGAIPEEYLVEYAVDRASTVGSVFLGLTLGCARCHDHKYDPVSQAEFFSLYAFFNSVEEPGLYSQLPDPNRAFEPFLVLPRPEQRRERDALAAELTVARTELAAGTPGDGAARAAAFQDVAAAAALAWETPRVVAARSERGATAEVLDDGSVRLAGAYPDQDVIELELDAENEGLRLVLLEALPDASFGHASAGRAENGNAVLTRVTVTARSRRDPARYEEVPLGWAWADHEQADGDHRAVNALDGTGDGWAIDGHRRDGARLALFLAERPFGFAGGTRLVVRLEHLSRYARHTLGRVRVRVARANARLLDALPAAYGTWHVAGPFAAESRTDVFGRAFGPETDAALDPARAFGAEERHWTRDFRLRDGALNVLPAGVVATYVGRRVHAPSARTIELAVGSDDGFRLFLDAAEVAAREVDRGLALDQDRATVAFPRGASTLVLKDVNTGGQGGFAFEAQPRANELAGDLLLGILPEDARGGAFEERLALAWQIQRSPAARAARARIAAVEARVTALESAYPRTMVMRELPMPRETYVLVRGEYDKPDRQRPAQRGVPAALGTLPPDAPRDRLGLARWMLAPENPLVARVAANRLVELVFGAGLVRTSEDFGHQGEWPTHKELLDWLAVHYRESGWDTRAMLRLLVTSATYRQASTRRTNLAEIDPDNRLLASFPRQRLPAESVRDLALHAAGLLVEELGGPSVKPYQPEGLWQEVAMPASNTRYYERGGTRDLWRRSLYTYWKRAAPPPTLLAFDAPTRESCVIRRATTNTPLQALALWNDPQFVEAARVLAQRTLLEAGAPSAGARDAHTTPPNAASAHAAPSVAATSAATSQTAAPTGDDDRIVRLVRRVTGARPDVGELNALRTTLADFRARYRAAPDDARALLAVGEAPRDTALDPAEHAAWTLLASAVLSLDAAITRD